MNKHFGLVLFASSLVFAGCRKEEALPAKTEPTASGNPITAPLDYIAAVGKAQQSAIKNVDTAALNQALQLFNVQEGRFPKDLQEMVPNYIGKIPAAPYGMKIDYDATQGKVKVVKQ